MSHYRYLTIFILILLCAGSVSFLHAQEQTDATTTDNTLSVPVNQGTARQNRGSETSLSKLAQTRLTNLAANMSNRMDAVASRLQNVIDRLDSRLNKMSDEGIGINAARSNLTDAQAKLDLAKASLVNIDTEVAAFTGSTNPRENWTSLKFTFLSIKDNLMASHKLILSAIDSAKQAAPKTNTPATEKSTSTSPDTSNQ